MKKKLFKLLIVIVIIGFSLIVYNFKSFSASIKLNLDKSSYITGDSFTLTVSGINGRIKIIPNTNLELNISDDQWVDGKLTVTGIAKKTGTGIITVIPVDVSTDEAEPEEVTEQMSIDVEIKEAEKQDIDSVDNFNNENNIAYEEEQGTISEFGLTDLYLYGIDENSKMIELEFLPKFDINIDTYKCQVQDNIKKVEIIYEANEYKDFVEVVGDKKELKYGENFIEIIIKDNDNNEKKYKIVIIKNQTKVEETVQEEILEKVEDTVEINEETKIDKVSSLSIIIFLIITIFIFSISILIYKKKLKTKYP